MALALVPYWKLCSKFFALCGFPSSTHFCPLILPVPYDLQALAFPVTQEHEGWGKERLCGLG